MPQPDGPWGRKSNPVPMGQQQRFLIWVIVILGGALALWKLSKAFPDVTLTNLDMVWLLNLVGFLALASAALIMGRRFRTKDTVRNIAIWCAVFAGLGIGYTFRNELGRIGDRVRGELIPGTPVASGAHEIALVAGEDGGYYVDGTINGAPVHFLIDTGSTNIVLTPRDAERAGIDMTKLDYSRPAGTANGVGFGAAAHVDRLVVGDIELHDVQVDVNRTPMESSLLGLAFLKRLDSFGVRNGRFVMRWH
jgi:aspartyl protease family protein